jgi:chorismate synthase
LDRKPKGLIMSANTFGHRFQFISFGESHGSAYGVVIDGMPAGVNYRPEILLKNLAERRPGKSHTTSRSESDQPEILSGIFENKTLGTPIAVVVKNENQKSDDYEKIKSHPRIGHADETWQNKFGHTDHRGGGRSSGRETLNRVIAGSFAQMLINKVSPKTVITSFAKQIGPHILQLSEGLPDPVISFLESAKSEGESYGGIIECRIQNPPMNLGQPIFHKFKSDLASAMIGIGATTGFEFGQGFSNVEMRGTEFHQVSDSENYAGIRGGITTGEDIVFRVAFKPTSSIKDVAKLGRHDPCIIPRAIPVITAMAWLVLADHYLWSKTDRI